MIEVEGLTKIYGDQRAVDALTFSVPRGQVVGFLGPNGAGKSTTMRILAGFIPQTSGRASVAGFDVEKDSLAVRRRVGYLPENNPLYRDLYVTEYLEFTARLFGLRNRRDRIETMIRETGLAPERRKRIGQLSKGYRQRVGLALALLHDPDVLILDEPTSGLDPNQLTEIRALIRELGREKTVVLSTHIMQEVKVLCDRVLIIHRGRLVADDDVEALTRTGRETVTCTVEFKEPAEADRLRRLPGVMQVEDLGEGAWRLTAPAGNGLQESLVRFAVEEGLTLLSSGREERSLEDVFRELTRSEA